ncbi:hypothetical protein [Candidatus Manganitrophus noduliformans]|uniref:Lipoprotein n=1 Tax=Candidatus Manganitrophus noduliformans TaxID=2606439 RepID=A0A7X6ICD0_9BACT|nr:hypothetical protein [Candidatus Manganitrophus noduliformans]NKE72426.1 hypothetical protein [Candidatus Manganitrophus noduliformans]
MKAEQLFFSKAKSAALLLVFLLIVSTITGCRVKIAGDDYIVGPFPTSNRGKEDQNRNVQEPAPRKMETKIEDKEDKDKNR